MLQGPVPDKPPEPPKVFYGIATDFAHQNPEATIADWVEFVRHIARSAWMDGYRAGAETKVLGIADQVVDPIVEESPYYGVDPSAVDYNKVVPLQTEEGNARGVAFVDEQGRLVEENEQ